MPGLAFSYDGGHPDVVAGVLPLVDYLEVSPDALTDASGSDLRLHEPSLRELLSYRPGVKYLVHGVGLSLASPEGYSRRYVQLLEQCLLALKPSWHSEHLAYTHVDGDSLGTMLPVPRTREALDLIVARVREIQARFALPFLLENVVSLLPEIPGEFTEAAFFNQVSAQTGCGLLLDAYNLYCDEVNGRLDLDAFLAELDLSRITEIHLAGGTRFRGWQVDVHSRSVPDPALRIAEDVLRRAPNVLVVTYELLEEAFDVMGTPAIVEEIGRLRSWLDAPAS